MEFREVFKPPLYLLERLAEPVLLHLLCMQDFVHAVLLAWQELVEPRFEARLLLRARSLALPDIAILFNLQDLNVNDVPVILVEVVQFVVLECQHFQERLPTLIVLPLVLNFVIEDVRIVHFDVEAEFHSLRIFQQLLQFRILLASHFATRKHLKLRLECVDPGLLLQAIVVPPRAADLLAIPMQLVDHE